MWKRRFIPVIYGGGIRECKLRLALVWHAQFDRKAIGRDRSLDPACKVKSVNFPHSGCPLSGRLRCSDASVLGTLMF